MSNCSVDKLVLDPVTQEWVCLDDGSVLEDRIVDWGSGGGDSGYKSPADVRGDALPELAPSKFKIAKKSIKNCFEDYCLNSTIIWCHLQYHQEVSRSKPLVYKANPISVTYKFVETVTRRKLEICIKTAELLHNALVINVEKIAVIMEKTTSSTE